MKFSILLLEFTAGMHSDYIGVYRYLEGFSDFALSLLADHEALYCLICRDLAGEFMFQQTKSETILSFNYLPLKLQWKPMLAQFGPGRYHG